MSRFKQRQRKRLKRIEKARRILLLDAQSVRLRPEQKSELAAIGRHVELSLIPLHTNRAFYPHSRARMNEHEWRVMQKLVNEGWDRV